MRQDTLQSSRNLLQVPPWRRGHHAPCDTSSIEPASRSFSALSKGMPGHRRFAHLAATRARAAPKRSLTVDASRPSTGAISPSRAACGVRFAMAIGAVACTSFWILMEHLIQIMVILQTALHHHCVDPRRGSAYSPAVTLGVWSMSVTMSVVAGVRPGPPDRMQRLLIALSGDHVRGVSPDRSDDGYQCRFQCRIQCSNRNAFETGWLTGMSLLYLDRATTSAKPQLTYPLTHSPQP